MGGRIERIIRAPVSRARRSPVGFRRKLPYESPVCSRRQRHRLGGSGDPALRHGNLGFRALGSVGLKAGRFAYIALRKHLTLG
jgi:hypothetical protein